MKLLGFVFLLLLALEEYKCAPLLSWLGSNDYHQTGVITNCFGHHRQWHEPINIRNNHLQLGYPFNAHETKVINDKPYSKIGITYSILPTSFPLYGSMYERTDTCWYDNGTPYVPYAQNTWYRPYDQHTPYNPYVRPIVPQYVPPNAPQYVPQYVRQYVPPYGSPYYRYDNRYPAYGSPFTSYYAPYYTPYASTYTYSFYTPLGQVHCRKSTDSITQNPVEKPVEKSTEKAEEKVTEKAEENVTEKAEEKVIKKAEETVTEKADEIVTEKAEEKVTEKAEETVTEKADEIVREKAEEKITEKETLGTEGSSSENFPDHSTVNPFDDRSTENVINIVTENPFNVERN